MSDVAGLESIGWQDVARLRQRGAQSPKTAVDLIVLLLASESGRVGNNLIQGLVNLGGLQSLLLLQARVASSAAGEAAKASVVVSSRYPRASPKIGATEDVIRSAVPG